MKKTIINLLKDGFLYIAGCLIFSFAVSVIIAPNGITPGGFTGLATSLNYIWGFNTGIVLLILNIPVLILAFIKIGTDFIIRTFTVTLILSFSLEITETFFRKIVFDKLLSAVFGGIIMGAGLSIILMAGATTGGVDIIAKLLNRRFPHITIGKIILISDIFVIGFATICYKNIESALYSVITLYASSRITDVIIYGFDKGKTAFIISEKGDLLCKIINENMKRGTTKIRAYGGYTNKEKTMLICTVRPYEISKLNSIIKQNDNNAFVILSDATEILGNGFKRI